MIDGVFTVFSKVKVVLMAVPTWGAAVVGLLTWVSVDLVPLLPGPWAVRAAAWAAAAVAAVQAVVSVVSRVTPILYGEDRHL